ncbi:TetR/AcrR family transcriptional regulator [Nocardia vaccinii]|uniref:TetR/AcrR family transcriptional regulator n=1 Tax=Nocardia vaccinii TaxID=1822 RepID=UPI001470B536|nr:TetR/AcrR family transcriptional regulator [Nocardia vaccinii]
MTSQAGRRADAIANREAILTAARVLLAENPSASLTAIAARAGVAPRTLYGHFATRDDLTRALATRIGSEITAHVTGIEDGPDALTTLARFVYETSAFNTRLYSMRQLSTEPGAREIVSEATALMRERLVDLIGWAHRDGQLDRQINTPTGVHLVAAIQWAIYDALAADTLTAAEAPRVAVKSALRALGADPRQVVAILETI